MDGIIERPIFLTGFMGAGKTTIGQMLAHRLQLPFMDQDKLIIEKEKMPISMIFERSGEEGFRKLENEMLKTISVSPAVISTGGGVVLKKENRELMNKKGVTIYLYCGPSQTEKRLENDSSRPLLAKNKKASITELMERRLPFYLEADYTINTSLKSESSILKEMLSLLNK